MNVSDTFPSSPTTCFATGATACVSGMDWMCEHLVPVPVAASPGATDAIISLAMVLLTFILLFDVSLSVFLREFSLQLARIPTNDDGELMDDIVADTDSTSSDDEDDKDNEDIDDSSDGSSDDNSDEDEDEDEDEIAALYATQAGDEFDEEIDRRGPMPSVGDVITFQLYDPYDNVDEDYDETIPVDFGAPGPSQPTTPTFSDDRSFHRQVGGGGMRTISTYGDNVKRIPESGTEYLVSAITNEVPNGKGQIVADRISNRGEATDEDSDTAPKHFLLVVPLRDPTASTWNVRWFIDWDHFTICQHEDGYPINEITSVDILEPPPIEEDMNDEYALYCNDLRTATEEASNTGASYGYGADLNFNDLDL